MSHTDNIRIAHLIISNAWGGAENVAFNIARHLSEETQQYIIVNEEIVGHFRSLEESGVKVFSLGRMYDCPAILRPFRYLRASREIRRIVETGDIRIIHFHLVWGMIAYYPLFRKLRRATAITLHGEVRSAHLRIRTRIERFVLWRSLKRHIDAVIPCSNELAGYLEKAGVYRPEITTIIHNGINETEWESVKPIEFPSPTGENGASPAPFRVLFVGNLRPEKGMDLLIEAVHGIYGEKGTLRKNSAQDGNVSLPDIEVFVIGKGDMMPRIEIMLKEYGLEKRVRLMGFVEKETMYGYYRSCDVLASLCDWEGCSIVQLEAMAAGLPIIATAVGGTPEILKDGRNGFLVERDVTAIKTAILSAARDPGLLAEMKANNRHDIENFYWRNIVMSYMKIYSELENKQ